MRTSCSLLRVLSLVCFAAVLLAGTGVSEAGTVKNVYNWSQLWNAVVTRQPGDEIIAHPGTYNVTNSLYMTNCAGLILRGSTGNPADVILQGPGVNNSSGSPYEAFQFVSANMTLRDLTIQEFYHHAVHFQDAGDGCVVDNVILRDNGEQYIKGAKWNDDIVIRNSLLEATKPRLNGLPGRPDNYVGGIDLHGARRALIQDNLVQNIIGLGDAGDGGIFMWNESQDSIVERNVVIGCSKGIEMGNPSDQGVWQVQNTIVRNNFILSRPGEDIGLELCYTKDVKVYNNTIYRTGDPWSADWGRTIHIYDNAAHPTTNLDIRNNIVRGSVTDNSTGNWSAAAIAAMGNIVDEAGTQVTSAWFVDAANLDLHLTALATAAINAGVVLPQVPSDFDLHPRTVGLPDMGADEYGSSPLMGDANVDGLVDGADYTLWADHYKLAGAWGDGNFNGDAAVDGGDYTLLADNFGADVRGLSFGGSAVPEPAAICLLAPALACLLRRRKGGR